MERKKIGKADYEELSSFLNRSPITIYRVLLDHFLFLNEEEDFTDSKLLTKDKKEFILLKTYYKISDREDIKNRILKIKGFKILKDGGKTDEILWVNFNGISFGEVYISNKEMIFLTDAREHLQKWKNLTKNIPLEFLNTKEIDQLEIVDKLFENIENDLFVEKPGNISTEEFRESAIKEWNDFYDMWFNQKQSYLGNKSPAEAMKTIIGKQRVMDLIDSYENEMLRMKKLQCGEDMENKIKYFNADELRNRISIEI